MSHGHPHQTDCTGEKMAFLERPILLRILSCGWALDVWGFLRVWQLQGPVQTPASNGGAWENTFQSLPEHLSEPLSGSLLGPPLFPHFGSVHIFPNLGILGSSYPLSSPTLHPIATFNPPCPLPGTKASEWMSPPPASQQPCPKPSCSSPISAGNPLSALRK